MFHSGCWLSASRTTCLPAGLTGTARLISHVCAVAPSAAPDHSKHGFWLIRALSTSGSVIPLAIVPCDLSLGDAFVEMVTVLLQLQPGEAPGEACASSVCRRLCESGSAGREGARITHQTESALGSVRLPKGGGACRGRTRGSGSPATALRRRVLLWFQSQRGIVEQLDLP